MRLFTFLAIIFLFMLSCKKDRLTDGYAILQGKWQWTGSDEIRENHVTGVQSYTWHQSTNYDSDYFFEFEQKGLLSYWVNESETEFFRIEKGWDDANCDYNLVSNCHYVGINLDFDADKFLHIYLNADTMKVISTQTHLPLQSYEDQVASYTYVHTFVRIN